MVSFKTREYNKTSLTLMQKVSAWLVTTRKQRNKKMSYKESQIEVHLLALNIAFDHVSLLSSVCSDTVIWTNHCFQGCSLKISLKIG